MTAQSRPNPNQQWYYASGRQKLGPFTFAQLQQLALGGQLLPSSMILQEGGSKWQAASSIANLFLVSTPGQGEAATEPVGYPPQGVGHVPAAAQRPQSQPVATRPPGPTSLLRQRLPVLAVALAFVLGAAVALCGYALVKSLAKPSPSAADDRRAATQGDSGGTDREVPAAKNAAPEEKAPDRGRPKPREDRPAADADNRPPGRETILQPMLNSQSQGEGTGSTSKKPGKEAGKTKKQYTEQELEKLVLGLSRREVRAALGAPDQISDNGNYWIYQHLVVGHPQVEIWFQQGVADLITH